MKPLFYGIGGLAENESIGNACWPHHDIIIVLSGTAHLTVGHKTWTCSPEHALHIAPQTPFYGQSGTTGCRLWVHHFAVNTTDRRDLKNLHSCGSFLNPATDEWPTTLRKRITWCHRQGAVGELPELLRLLIRALGEIGNAVPAEHADFGARKIQALRASLDNEPHPLPSVDVLAARLGWSRGYFTARFKQHCGEGPGEYLHNLRLEQAGRLLRETRLPIKAISVRLGYSDTVAFHRAFRNAHGVTPSTYRNRAPTVI